MRIRALIAALLVPAALLSLVSCKKDINVEYCELGIVLTKDFEKYDSNEVFDDAYSNGEAIVAFTRYSFVDCIEYGFLSTLTPERFAEVHLEKSGKSDSTSVEQSGDVPYYCYTNKDSLGNEYFYMLAFYRTPYAYFVITFITPAYKSEEMLDKFIKIANSAYILEEHI